MTLLLDSHPGAWSLDRDERLSRAALYDWARRDPFDRTIAATAQVLGLGLLSADATLDSVPGRLRRLW